jgi:peptidyl-prolyl cis-trans isomerase-like 4
MSILLETTLGDLVIDLDVDGSPALCKNILKLCKVRYYTENLVYNVQPNRFFQLGDPRGDGIGGACIYGVLDAYETARKIKINDAALQKQKQNQKQNNSTKPNVMLSKRRFLKSDMGRPLTENECQQRGMVVSTELGGIADTIGSQLLITIADGPDHALDGFRNNHNSNNNSSSSNNNNLTTTTSSNEPLTAQIFRSVGTVVEDDNDVLTKMNSAYCDANGRPYADVRVIRALVIDDPFDDPTGMDQLLVDRGVTVIKVKVNNDDDNNNNDDDDDDDGNKQMDDDDDDDEIMYKVMASPEYERPPEEIVETRIRADQIDDDNADDEIDLEKIRKQEEERYKREDKSRAVVLEMLGDLPSADMTAPENVLFVCKLNPVTEDDDLDLIFSRFDEKVKADIVRDSKTGASLQYAFVEFTTKERATEAYFKMNNALVDDRRIKVDFSQSVSKVWDKFNQVKRRGSSSTNKQNNNNNVMPRDPFKEQKLPLGRPHQHQQQQQQQKQAPRRDNRFGNSNNMSNEQRRGGNSSNDHNQRHHYQREDIHHSSSNNRERNRDRNSAVDGNNRERNDSYRDDERYRYRDDRRDDRRDNRTHPAQRNRDRDHHSRDDENDRGRPTRTRQASPENDHRSGSKYEERYRRDDRDRRRRSRSRSDDDEKRERKRSRKKSSHRKHEKRDRKHSRHREVRHHKERDSGSRHRRRSPSSSV